MGQAFQPAMIGISEQVGWKACPTKTAPAPERLNTYIEKPNHVAKRSEREKDPLLQYESESALCLQIPPGQNAMDLQVIL